MKASPFVAVALLIAFFVLVFVIAFFSNSHYPLQVIAGESSVGTWMSGVLLVISFTISLILGMCQGRFQWFLIAAFFVVLALDERFMFHEQLKERIIFSFNTTTRLIYELPVIAGACAGAFITYLLWNNLKGISRILLLFAALLGIASVTIDVLAGGVFWEESFKLLAELLVACALLNKVDTDIQR